MDGFEVAMNHQREQARAAGKFKAAEGLSYSGVETRFDGYDQLQSQGTVTALYIDGTQVESVSAGQQAIVVLDATPFYAESGGQVGDAGILQANGARFAVADPQKIQNSVFGHHGEKIEGVLAVGDTVDAQVDKARRDRKSTRLKSSH